MGKEYIEILYEEIKENLKFYLKEKDVTNNE
jgi:hypothetical protein